MLDKVKQFYSSLFQVALQQGQFIELREIDNCGIKQRQFFSSIDDLIDTAQKLDANQTGKYFSACPRFRKSGKKEDVNLITAVYIDLDVGSIGHAVPSYFATKEEALKYVDEFSLKPSWIIDTGNGLDLFWRIEPTRVNDENRRAIERILEGLANHFKADTDAAEIARMLRCPGPWNRKNKHNAVPVPTGFVDKCHYDPDRIYSIADFETLAAEANDSDYDGQNPPACPSDLSADAVYDQDFGQQESQKGLDVVIDHCPFIQWCRYNQAQVSEPQWYSMISNLARFQGGREKIHEFSRQYPGYSWEETDAKIQHAMEASGPHTCRSIQESAFKGCPDGGCGVKSPAGLPFRTIIRHGNRYYRDGRKITSFVIAYRKSYVSRETGDILINVDIITENNRYYRNINLTKDAWIRKQNLLKELHGHEDVNYYGSDTDLQHIRSFLSKMAVPRIETVDVVGLHTYKDENLLVFPGGTIDHLGRMRSELRYVQLPDKSLKTELLKAETPDLQKVQDQLDPLFRYNSPTVTVPINGWMFYIPFLPVLFRTYRQSPFLLIHGEAGAGKTETLHAVIMPFFGLRDSILSIGFMKKFGFLKTLSISNNIPAIFDENKISRQYEMDRNTISEILRSSYNHENISRGRPDQTQVYYRLIRPVIVSGEEAFDEAAITDRCVDVSFSRSERSKTPGNSEALAKLKKSNLTGVGKEYYVWSIRQKDTEIVETFQNLLEMTAVSHNDRTRYNMTCVKFGLVMFGKFCKERYGIENIHLNDAINESEALLVKIMGQEHERKSTVDAIIEHFSIMAESERTVNGRCELNEGEDYCTAGNTLRLNVAKIFPKFKEWARRTQYSNDMMDKKTFMQQLEKQEYFIAYKHAKIGGRTNRCHILDLTKMERLDIQAFRYSANLMPMVDDSDQLQNLPDETPQK